MRIEQVKITKLQNNTGQIAGLPKNPRFIRDERFEKLVQSIRDFPEMLELRELVVVEHEGKYVVVGGNMRLRAIKQLGYTVATCKVLSADTPVERLREFAVKDNVGFGQDDFDELSNEWDEQELTDWGMELPAFEEDEEEQETLPKEDETDMIAVTLTDSEKAEWLKAKEYLKIKNDKKAIFRLVEFMWQVENENK